MHAFPIFRRTTDRKTVIAGRGEQVAQNCPLMQKTGAKPTLRSNQPDQNLATLVTEGGVQQDPAPITRASFAGAAIGLRATRCPGRDVALHHLAKRTGVRVDVFDPPQLCDVATPSIVDRDPVEVAIGTGPSAPVLARLIKSRLGEMLDAGLGLLAALAGRLRAAVAQHAPQSRRRTFWHEVFTQPVSQLYKSGSKGQAVQAQMAKIHKASDDPCPVGSIALVGAGPGARDLLTLRAVERLQSADVIFYDRLVDPKVLELARCDAQRVYVGKAVGAHEWPQERINEVVLTAAQSGQNVVRLKSGDPSVFGRASEELQLAKTHGIPVETIPGITAASAAAAALGQSLTERGVTDHVVLATGTCRPEDAAPDWAAMLSPGATLVLYMAVHSAGTISASALEADLPGSLSVDIVERVSTTQERIFRSTLADLARDVRDNGISSPALLILRNPKFPAHRAACTGSNQGENHALQKTAETSAAGVRFSSYHTEVCLG